MRLKTFVTFIVFFWIGTIAAQANNDTTKAVDYELDVSFTPSTAYMQAEANITLETDSPGDIEFYLHGELKVDSLFLNGDKVDFTEDKEFSDFSYSLIVNKVKFSLPKQEHDKCEIQVVYSGYFHPSKARCASDYMRIDPDDGVLLRGYGYSLWFPFFSGNGLNSHPTNFTKVVLRTPENYKSLFTGNLLDEYIDGQTRIAIWEAMNIFTLNTQCTAREFDVLSQDNTFIYYMKNNSSRICAQKILEFSKNINADYSNYYKPTNKGKPLYIMEMVEFGDISSGNVIGISSKAWHNFDKDVWTKILISHELVHSYVLIPIEREDPLFALVIEGFPSYYNLPILAKYLKENWYDEEMVRIEESYLYKKAHGVDPRGMKVPAEKPILSITDQEVGEYKDVFVLSDRAILFLNYLRQKMGEKSFIKFSKELFAQDSIDYSKFEKLILTYLPEIKTELSVWLRTTEYPEAFHLKNINE